MHYYAKIAKEDGSYLVSFPEFPNVNTYGDTLEEALKNAEEALNGAFESDFERGYKLPESVEHQGKCYHMVKVFPHLEVAFKLRALRKNESQIEIAKKLGISYQAYQKLENPRRCNPTIKTLEKLSSIFGKELQVSFR
jgi:antitoxin HicB